MATLIILIVLFLALSGLMAAVDAAVLGVTRPEVHELIAKGKCGARPLRKIKREITKAVVVIVVLTNTVNVLGPIVVSRQAVDRFGTPALALTMIVLTLGSIIFSEIIPKAIGTRYAPTISRIAAPMIRAVQIGLYPLVGAIESISGLFTSGSRRIGTEEQIRSLTKMGREAGYIEADEGRLIRRAFVLNDKTAADIMTPLDRVVSVNAATTIAATATQVRQSIYSRFPVFGQSPEQVEGMVMIRDILEAIADERGGESIGEIIREPLIVKADEPVDDLLVRFRNRSSHLAVVVDNGRTVGVVTLEDALEELVGEIEDELDVEQTNDSQGSRC